MTKIVKAFKKTILNLKNKRTKKDLKTQTKKNQELINLTKEVFLNLNYFKKLVENEWSFFKAFNDLKKSFEELENTVPKAPAADEKIKKIEALERQIKGRKSLLKYHYKNKPEVYKKHLQEIAILNKKIAILKK